MANIKIKGVGTVKAPEGFTELSKQEQQKVVNRLAREAMDERKPESSGLGAAVRTAGQGLTFGFGDEIEAGLRTGFGLMGDYDEAVKDVRDDIDIFRRNNPEAALALEIGGGLLTGGAGGARALASAAGRKIASKIGTAGTAGLVGAGEGALAGFGAGDGDLNKRLEGAGAGALFGGAIGAGAPALINTGKKAVNRALFASGMKSDDAARIAADRKVLEKLEGAGKTPEAVQGDLDALRADGVADPMIIDVAGRKTQGLARASAVVSDEGTDIAQKALDDRALDMGDRIADDVFEVMGSGKSSADALDEIAQRQAANAGNDYDAAFNANGKPVTVPVTESLKDLLSLPAFDEAVEQANKLAMIDRVGLPSAKDLIAGKKIENLSVQELHYIKMGLDEVMGLGKRGQSKTSIGRGLERGLKKARAELIDIIDNASPKVLDDAGNEVSAYKIARNKFAGDARLREAIEQGEGFFTMKANDLDDALNKMSDSEKEAFRIGVAQAVRNSVDNIGDMADAGKKIFGKKKQRKMLRKAFPDDASFEQFEKRMNARAEQAKTRSRVGVNQGSRTAVLDDEINDMGRAASIAQFFMNPTGAAGVAESLYRRAGMPEQIGRSLAGDLFSLDPRQQADYLNRLVARREADRALQQRALRNTGRISGISGMQAGLLTGEQ
jgi:hypothetical protein